MQKVGRIVALGILLSGVFILPNLLVESAQARCCSTDGGGCNGASETGCAMGSPMNMFFADPCECESGSCVDGGSACGGTPADQCGDGGPDAGEDCDEGDENGTFASCCTIDCNFKSDGALCDDGTFCDGLGACNATGTCIENAGPTCPDPERCNEEQRTCSGADAPTVSTVALVVLASAMLLGALSMLRRRRLRQDV